MITLYIVNIIIISDINECTTDDQNSCDKNNGTCTNIHGGYECGCNDGFDLAVDLFTCEGQIQCQVP